MLRLIVVYFAILLCLPAKAQFPPQVGMPGCDAISGTSNLFVGWATGCTVQRGYVDIDDTSMGFASDGDSSMAIGAADNNTVSLGDSGIAVVTFAHPIVDGPGPDFAVFENGFFDMADSSLAFLELGFVEVSSDGIYYTRFPATSLTSDTAQVGAFGYLDATKLRNLAGKYIARWGTPFDLAELAGTPGLDVNHITHVRIIDVIGAIRGPHYTTDSAGRIVNDPFPTPFPSCGFDLDAVGVINQEGTWVANIQNNADVKVYPNPATDKVMIVFNNIANFDIRMTLTTLYGTVVSTAPVTSGTSELLMSELPAGLYLLQLTDKKSGQKWLKNIEKY